MNLGISAFNYVNSIKNGDFTAEEFIEKSFERIKEVDDKLHAFLSFNDIALERLRELIVELVQIKKLDSVLVCQFLLKTICV